MLGYIFDHGSNRKVFWDYDPSYASVDKPDPDVIENFGFISRRFLFLHGHFYFRKYAGVAKTEHVITCIRHPLHRIISQFKHEVYNCINGARSWRSELILQGKMDLVDFITSDENIRLAQIRHLDGLALKDYSHIFLHENLDNSLAAFCSRFNFSRNDPHFMGLPRINAGEDKNFASPAQQRKYIDLTSMPQASLQEAFTLIPEEVEFYIEASALARKQFAGI